MSDESYPDYRMAGSPPGRRSRGEVYSLHPGEGKSPWDLERVGGSLWLQGGAGGAWVPEAGGVGDEGGGGGRGRGRGRGGGEGEEKEEGR